MATIDLIVLGIVKSKPMSAYDIQKLVEYRNISRWVKISTPSIYKKVIQLEQKGLIEGSLRKEGNMPEKTIYSLTESGETEFQNLMFEISEQPINIFLDFNAVIVNLEHLNKEQQHMCIERIEHHVLLLKEYLMENIHAKVDHPDIPDTGKAVLRQQFLLVEAIEAWIVSVKETIQL